MYAALQLLFQPFVIFVLKGLSPTSASAYSITVRIAVITCSSVGSTVYSRVGQ